MRPGLILWALLDFCWIVKQVQDFGQISNSILLTFGFQLWYVFDAEFNEVNSRFAFVPFFFSFFSFTLPLLISTFYHSFISHTTFNRYFLFFFLIVGYHSHTNGYHYRRVWVYALGWGPHLGSLHLLTSTSLLIL